VKCTVTATAAGEGKVRLHGTVSQEGVSSNFVSVVPLYAEFGKDATIQIGSVRLVGSTSQTIETEAPMPKVPKRILVNAYHDWLVRE
jgi:hypothetical protein